MGHQFRHAPRRLILTAARSGTARSGTAGCKNGDATVSHCTVDQQQ